MRLIVVGARGATRDLLRRLGERWEATVVDPDIDLLARAANVREIDQVVGAAGVLLAGQFSVIIALADLGLDLGLLSSGLRAGAIMLVAVLSPVGFRFLAPPLQNLPDDVGRRRLLGRS